MPHFQGTEDMLGFIHLVKNNNDNTYKLTTDYDTFVIHPDWKFSSEEDDYTFVYALHFMINEAFYRFNFYMDTSDNNKIEWLAISEESENYEEDYYIELHSELLIDKIASDDKNIYLS
jgi:hypothetical protein